MKTIHVTLTNMVLKESALSALSNDMLYEYFYSHLRPNIEAQSGKVRFTPVVQIGFPPGVIRFLRPDFGLNNKKPPQIDMILRDFVANNHNSAKVRRYVEK